MPRHARRSPARLIAPLALALCAVALVAVVTSSDIDGDESAGTADGPAGRTDPGAPARTETAPSRGPAFYTVETGDTLGAIAETTGVSVERLLELNPELDPQALVSGQRIKLRE